MRRCTPILALLLVAAAVAPALAQPPDALGEWIAREIKVLGWNYVGRSTAQGLVLYAKEAPPSTEPEVKRIYARYEHRMPVGVRGTLVRSSMALQEFDCESREGHTLQSTYYSANNLTGGSFMSGEEQWTLAAPGTAYEMLMQRACGDEEE
jgi:hypothetical protein